MKSRMVFLATAPFLLIGTLQAIAEEEEAPALARNYFIKIKPGHNSEFEAGLKKQIEWYKQNNETWHWHTWQWETGENTDHYIFRSPGHHWKDMDERSERTERASAHFREVVGTHVESMHSNIGRVLFDVTDWPEDLGPVQFVTVDEFNIHYGMVEEFLHVIGKLHKAIQEADWGVHYAWVSLVSGGEVPTFILVLPHKSWSDMEGPDTPFRKMLENTVGRVEADALLAGLKACIRTQHSALARFRPELSYMPGE